MRRTRSASRSASGVEQVDPSELTQDAISKSTPLSRDDLLDALTCPISGKLFVDPVTAVCGHTFSRRMLALWMNQPGRQSSCPTCRSPLYHESPHQWPVNTTIVDLCERFLNDALSEARGSEPTLDFPPFDSQLREGNANGSPGRRGSETSDSVELPVFVLDPMIPGQEITLNVFEERYKRMVRRCMQHTRRFGMVAPADQHHEGATRAVTTREPRVRKNMSKQSGGNVDDENENAPSDSLDSSDRVYASSEEEEDQLDAEASGDFSGNRQTRSGVGRRVDPVAGPFAFLDHGVECVVTAFQESIDGRVLVRCRATRHVRVLSAREDEAGYAVARVTPVAPSEIPRSAELRSAPARAAYAAGVPNKRPSDFQSSNRVDRLDRDSIAFEISKDFGEWSDAFCGVGVSSTDMTTNPSWFPYLKFLAVSVATNARAKGDEWTASRLRLRLERAVGMHRVWLAHVAGRPLEEHWDGVDSDVRSRTSSVPWVRGTRDFFRRSYGGKAENLLALNGERPRADREEELSWWLTRVANPLPPLGAALELRGAALSTSSATRRFSRIYRGVVESMRSVHRLDFKNFRGARPTSGAAVAIAWCRAVELAAKQEDEYKRGDSGVMNQARLGNRQRLAKLAKVAIEILFTSAAVFHDLPSDVDENGTAIDGNWPAMSSSPIPGHQSGGLMITGQGLGGLPTHALETPGRTTPPPPDASPHLSAAETLQNLSPDQVRNLKKRASDRFAFLLSRGGAPKATWEMYRHLSRFSDTEFEMHADAVRCALEGDDDDDQIYSLPDDFPKPGDAKRARQTVGVAPGRTKRASFFDRKQLVTDAQLSAVAKIGHVARVAVWSIFQLILATFTWVVAGIGHLVFSVVAGFLQLIGRDPRTRAEPFPPGVGSLDLSPGRHDNTGMIANNNSNNSEFSRLYQRNSGGVGKLLFAATCATILFWVLDSPTQSGNGSSHNETNVWSNSLSALMPFRAWSVVESDL